MSVGVLVTIVAVLVALFAWMTPFHPVGPSPVAFFAPSAVATGTQPTLGSPAANSAPTAIRVPPTQNQSLGACAQQRQETGKGRSLQFSAGVCSVTGYTILLSGGSILTDCTLNDPVSGGIVEDGVINGWIGESRPPCLLGDGLATRMNPILMPDSVKIWCTGSACRPERFTRLIEANGVENLQGVKFVTGSPVTIALPNGFSADVWDCFSTLPRAFGPTTLTRVCEATIRMER